MYKEHPVFEPPEDINVIIWRYMNYDKFESIIQKQKLFFALPAAFNDNFEGHYPRGTVEEMRESIATHYKGIVEEKKADEVCYNMGEANRYDTIVSCWNMNTHEKVSLWERYTNIQEGIAIQSTFNHLCNSFKCCPIDVYIGKVKYIDHDTAYLKQDYSFRPLLHKRLYYEDEQELRAMTILKTRKGYGHILSDNQYINDEDIIPNMGAFLNVNLNELIQSIVISHKVEENKKFQINKILNENGLNKPVLISKLSKEPKYN